MVKRPIKTDEKLLVMAEEYPKPWLNFAMLTMLKYLRTVKQQSINCIDFEAHFGWTAITMWHNLLRPPSN